MLDINNFFRQSGQKANKLPYKFREFSLQIGKIGLYKPLNYLDLDIFSISAPHYERRNIFNLSFYDFSNSLSKNINSTIDSSKRITKNNKKINVLAFSDKNLLMHDLEQISLVANKRFSLITKDNKKVYSQSLKNICRELSKYINFSDCDGIVVPLNGGGLIADALPVDLKKLILIECKRVFLKKENEIGLGMNLYSKNFSNKKLITQYSNRLKSLNNKKIKFLEVSIASGLTTSAFLLELYSYNIKPKSIEIISPMVSQQGAEVFFKVADDLNYKVTLLAGQMFYKLGNYWQGTEDSILNDDGSFAVGKATKILSHYLDKLDYNMFILK